MSKRYQIVVIKNDQGNDVKVKMLNTAGTKAPNDAIVIAEKIGFQPIYMKCMFAKKRSILSKVIRQICYCYNWIRNYKIIQDNSTVFLQYPFYINELFGNYILYKLYDKKHIRFIFLVHDIEELRVGNSKDYYKKEFGTMIKICSAIIVHNENMKQFIIGKGVRKNKIICLEAFDYLQTEKKIALPIYEKSITIAGNLDTLKCGYIGELGKIANLKINLYGSNLDEKIKKFANVIYHGSYPPDEIPSKLNAGFGLVWDGDSIETCSGAFGQYLRYNNPHKLSLYLSCNMPVVVWKEAAIAEFVIRNNCGIAVDSLYDVAEIINKMDEDEYNCLCFNAAVIGDRLRNGEYLTTALLKAIGINNISKEKYK